MGLFVALESRLGWMRRSRPFRLWFPICAVTAGLLVWTLYIAYWGDFGVFLLFLVLCPTLAAILIGVAAMNWRQWRYGLPTLLLVFAVSWFVESKGYVIHADCRWLLRSKDYKAKLLAEPEPHASELKHLDWDGWGMAGQDTEVYLVFDSKNSLVSASRAGTSGKFAGIPCGVSKVLRLEDHWYAVVLYTNSGWDWDNKDACYGG